MLPLFIKNCTESCCKDKIINSEFIFGIVSTTIKLPIILNYISFKYDIISFLPTYDLKGNNLIVIYIKEHKENFYQRYFYGGNIFDSKLFYNEKIFKDLYYREIFKQYSYTFYEVIFTEKNVDVILQNIGEMKKLLREKDYYIESLEEKNKTLMDKVNYLIELNKQKDSVIVNLSLKKDGFSVNPPPYQWSP